MSIIIILYNQVVFYNQSLRNLKNTLYFFIKGFPKKGKNRALVYLHF